MPFLTGGRKPHPERKLPRPQLQLEVLEDRCLLTGNKISGFVFDDLNNNGLRDPGEAPLANSRLDLRNASGQVVATTTSDANGYYEFDRDATINRNPVTLTRTLTFAATPTDFDLEALLTQFDPGLGTLVGVDFQLNGFIKSKIWAENLSTSSTARITGTVTGSLTLTGGGVTTTVNTTPVQQQFNASRYDGTTDYAGASGIFFGERTSNGSGTITIGANDPLLQNFVGNSTVSFTLTGEAASTATGGGNINSQFDSRGGGTVTVTFRYILDDSLRPGTYTIVQTTQPAGYLDGKESRNGTVLPNSIGTDTIVVTLTNQDATDNNFGEVQAAQLCGTVYIDANNDGQHDVNETGIPGVVMLLTGTDDRGRSVRIQQATTADGEYCFTGLRPGDYTIKQPVLANFLAGQVNNPGSLGGQAQVNCFTDIHVTSGNQGTDYNFAWLKPAVLSGYVYADANKNGVKDAGERGLAAMRVVLDGTDDLGRSIHLVVLTNGQGYYQFNNLRPGSYTITQTTKPAGFQHGQTSVGTLGGGLGTQQISEILVAVGDFGQNYNFGKVRIAAVCDGRRLSR
jgi:hypothetical protein